jgi:Arginine methyltransferase-interacting protein, contains RING Zn-finger
MPNDEKDPTKSKGRAYITFQLQENAESIIENMNEKRFEGRILRISLASERPQLGRDSLGGTGGGGKRAASARYFVDDITTKCFRCGQVGHTVSSCTNEEMSKPCPLCAKTGHDSYACPLNKICFNCGVPGHINRECPERRGMSRRMVCGSCFISGHHKWECRERVYNIPSYGAKCLVCGKDGHFMCDTMKWFFGLRGIFCFNCGRKGHHGSNCDRPTVDECMRNPDLVLTELERAEAKSIEDELEELRQRRREEHRQRDRGRQRNNQSGNRDRERAKSQPAPNSRFRPSEKQSSKYGRL